MPRNSSSLARTWPHRSSRSKMSRLASATAAATGCPPNVNPWVNISLPCMNGSAIRSDTISAPIGT